MKMCDGCYADRTDNMRSRGDLETPFFDVAQLGDDLNFAVMGQSNTGIGPSGVGHVTGYGEGA